MAGKKAIPIPSNPAADDAAREAAATWLREHASGGSRLQAPARVGGAVDEYGEPVLSLGVGCDGQQRTEVVVVDQPTYVVTVASDGTVRKDNRAPLSEAPAPVTVDTQYRYSKEDLARMTLNKEAASARNTNWFAK